MLHAFNFLPLLTSISNYPRGMSQIPYNMPMPLACLIGSHLAFTLILLDLLQKAGLDSHDAKEVLNTIKDSFLNSRPSTAWKPKQVEVIRNIQLEKEFQ